MSRECNKYTETYYSSCRHSVDMTAPKNVPSRSNHKQRKTSGITRRLLRQESIFLLLLLIAAFAGCAVGLWFNPQFRDQPQPTADMLFYMKLPGVLFLRLMKLLVVPLAVCSNIDSFSYLDLSQSRRIGWTTMSIFLGSSLIASTCGASTATLFRFIYDDSNLKEFVEDWANTTSVNITDVNVDIDLTMVAMTMNIVPDSVFESSFRKSAVKRHSISNEMQIHSDETGGPNLIGLLFFSIIFGVIVGALKPRTSVVAQFFHGCRKVFVTICAGVIWIFPFGIFSMVASHLSNTHNLVRSLANLGVFSAAIFTAFFLYWAALLIIFSMTTHQRPHVLLVDMFSSLICATATASSAATMPLTLKCMNRVKYVHPTAVRFVLPLGCTLNMNGTCIFQSAASLFLMQCAGQPIDLSHMTVAVLCAMMASTITGALPSGSLISILITLDALQVPLNFVELLYPIDWMLDRLRTPTNVMGNAVTVVLVSKVVNDKTSTDTFFYSSDSILQLQLNKKVISPVYNSQLYNNI